MGILNGLVLKLGGFLLLGSFFHGLPLAKAERDCGPMFYAADYSQSIEGEPEYSTQNTKTFSTMNIGDVPSRYRGESVKVAVIDSGINYGHEDFMLGSQDIVEPDSRSIEYSDKWYYYPYSSHPSHLKDSLGHGTNVASVIASQINAVGCAGLAPNVDLYVYKVTNANNGYEWEAIKNALQYCIDNKIDVVNMSFQAYEHAVSYGGSSMSASTGCSTVLTPMINKCYNAGITLVGATGNFNTPEPSYPASNSHVISVGSLAEGSTHSKAGFSNTYGIDLVAPGYVYVADKGNADSYKSTQGTSFSAPIVTAAIALYKQKNPTATPDQIEAALYASCDRISSASWCGKGRLNLSDFLDIDPLNHVDSLTLNNVQDDTLELNVEDTFDLEWTVSGTGDYSNEVEFSFDEGGIASIDENGKITALAEGFDVLTVSSKENPKIAAEIFVVVSPKPAQVVGLEVVEPKTAFYKGDEFSFGGAVNAVYDDSSKVDVTSDCSFSGYSMSSIGEQTVRVTYGDFHEDYGIRVYRSVIVGNTYEGTIDYSQNRQDVTGDFKGAITTETENSTAIENGALKFGASKKVGSMTISLKPESLDEPITCIVVTAKAYGSDTGVNLRIGTTDFTLTSSYETYRVDFEEGQTSVKLQTTINGKRSYISSIVLTSDCLTQIGQSEDCVAIEDFIVGYMHMDYVQNLGYCADKEHHYYSSARDAFNLLSKTKRDLFLSNDAYAQESARLIQWASVNHESVTSDNVFQVNSLSGNLSSDRETFPLLLLTLGLGLSVGALLLLLRKKKRQ
ncbi:MAG: hypothetical protein E7179_01675 [Erysipelotrichaceae bacterium]|jgi:hypothetical protein|nr:hypothetical protein [Erysipelotrichaceae bacterium]